jgi:hypothetical protein
MKLNTQSSLLLPWDFLPLFSWKPSKHTFRNGSRVTVPLSSNNKTSTLGK